MESFGEKMVLLENLQKNKSPMSKNIFLETIFCHRLGSNEDFKRRVVAHAFADSKTSTPLARGVAFWSKRTSKYVRKNDVLTTTIVI